MTSSQEEALQQEPNKGPNKDILLKDGNRLIREEQLKVIQWLIERRTYQEISDLVKEKFGKTIRRDAFYHYAHSKKWNKLIKRLRDRFEKNLLKIPIANKAHRLRFLQKVVDEGFKWSLKNISKDGDEIYELKLGAVVEAVREARKEIEGERPMVDLKVGVNVTQNFIQSLPDKDLDEFIDRLESRGKAAIPGIQG